MRKIFFPLTVLLICTVLIIGCAKPVSTPAPVPTPTPAPAPAPAPTIAAKYGGTLRYINIAGPQTACGWPVDIIGPDSQNAQFCLEPLLRGDSKGNVSPWLAESYKVSDDLQSVTFALRKGVKFHDGTDFNAKAAKWNLDKAIAAKSQPNWKSVDVIDDYTIKVNFNQRANNNLLSFADDHPASWMVSPTAFEKNGVEWMRNNPVGTGPFKFVSFQRDVNYKVVKNPDYWIKGKPYLDALEILYIADPTTQKAAMQAGEVDALQMEPGKMAADLEALRFKVVNVLTRTYCFLPDSAHPDSPYANQKVREAVEYALDREAIAKAFSYGYWKATYQIPPTGSVAYNPDFTLARKYNPDKAKQLLADAGYSSGFKTTILVLPALVNRDIPVALQSYLSAIGISAELSFPANMGKFTNDSNSLNNVLVLQSTGQDLDDPFKFFMGPGFLWNHNFLPPPEFLKLRDAATASPVIDPNLIRAAIDELSKEAAAIPIFQGGMGWASKTDIMDGGWAERLNSLLFKPEQAWINR